MAVTHKLQGIDYFTIPMRELRVHPDYSERAFRAIVTISKMDTEELEVVEEIFCRN